MLNFDPEAAPEENAVNMMAAAEKVATGLITYAARDSEFDGRPIRKGEIMALENGKIVATGSDITKMTYRLARSMKKKDSQFITVISGAEVSEEDAEHTTELVQSKCGSSVEVSHIHGGQPVYYYARRWNDRHNGQNHSRTNLCIKTHVRSLFFPYWKEVQPCRISTRHPIPEGALARLTPKSLPSSAFIPSGICCCYPRRYIDYSQPYT